MVLTKFWLDKNNIWSNTFDLPHHHDWTLKFLINDPDNINQRFSQGISIAYSNLIVCFIVFRPKSWSLLAFVYCLDYTSYQRQHLQVSQFSCYVHDKKVLDFVNQFLPGSSFFVAGFVKIFHSILETLHWLMRFCWQVCLFS